MSRRVFLRASVAGSLAWYAGLREALRPVMARQQGLSFAQGLDEFAASPAENSGRLLIRNGTLVTDGRRFRADIRIAGGKITELGPSLPAQEGEEEIEARGLFVLPGGIDPHVHLNIPSPYTWAYGGPADDFTSGSMAAVAGGITTVGNITFPKPGERLLEAVAREGGLVRAQAIADVMLHPVAMTPSWLSFLLRLAGIIRESAFAELRRELPRLAAEGHPSIKIFMNFPEFPPNADSYLEVVRDAGRAGILTMLHCEDYASLERAAATLAGEKKTSLRHFAESRPIAAEVTATQRAVEMCEKTGAPIYVVHLSSGAALQVCEKAQKRGLPVHVETRPIYLHLTSEQLRGADGALYVGHPPLREREDQDALWAGLANGTIHTLGTDHIAWTREQKLDPSLTIEDHHPGMNNLQVMLPMFYNEGVRKNRITLERFVTVTSTNAAKLFGLYPQKGTIRVGSDADLVLWDFEETRKIRKADLLSRSGFSIYEGWEVTGWPRLTLRRGAAVYRKGDIEGPAGSGQLLHRKPWKRASVA